MTKRKQLEGGPYSPLERAQWRLRRLAMDLETGVAPPSGELKFLISSLRRIGEGEDANAVLNVKAKRGQRKTKAEATRRDKVQFAISWIAAAITPKPEGRGLTLNEAIEKAAKAFRMSYDTLKTHWGNHPELRTSSFSRPISSLP
jgi:hypothetical protein